MKDLKEKIKLPKIEGNIDWYVVATWAMVFLVSGLIWFAVFLAIDLFID